MSPNWARPISLSTVREHLEKLNGTDFDSDYLPGNLVVVGFISGYRVLNRTPDFRELQLSISQGLNEELRLVYSGTYPILMNSREFLSKNKINYQLPDYPSF